MCSHSVETYTESTVDILRGGDLQVAISRTGAELFSIELLREGMEPVGFMHRDGILTVPSSGWANHATVMGYYIHRLWQERSSYEGREIRGGNHGFIRHFQFSDSVFDQQNCALSYHIDAAAVPEQYYPLKVSCTITYRIVGTATLEIGFAFKNEEEKRAAHLSFGLHPGFAVTSIEEFDFAMPPGTYRRLLAPGNFLSGEMEVIQHPGGSMPFAKEALPGSYLVDLSEVPQRHFQLFDFPSGRKISFDLADCPYLTLWSDGTDFLCVEPCWGMPDSNPPTPFEQKIGIQEIPPLTSLEKSICFTFDAGDRL